MQIRDFIIFDLKKINFFIKIIFLLTAVYFCGLFVRGRIEINLFILLIFLFFIHYSLFIIYFRSKKESHYIPIYPLIIFYYLVTYSLYFYFYQELDRIRIIDRSYLYPNIYNLIKTLLIGLISFSSGYFFLNYFNFKKNSYNLPQINKYEFHLITVFLVFIFFYYFNYDRKFFNLSLINQLKEPIMIFLLAYFQIKYLSTKNIFFLLSFIFLFLILFFIEISFGATVFPGMLILVPLLLSFYKNQKINIISILSIILLLFIVHSSKNSIRNATWTFDEEVIKTNEILSKKSLKDSLILNKVKKTADVYLNKTLNKVLDPNTKNQKNRLFHSNISLQIVLTQTPVKVNFYNGMSYKALQYKFVPRFLFDDKPKEEWGNFWGKRYNILNPEDTGTSWNFTVLNEFYANFGVKGVIVGMFLLGLLIKILLMLFCFKFNQPILLAMITTIMHKFIFLENNLTLILGGVINQLLFFSVIIISILFLNFLIKKISN
jgi:hypothetical protein